MRPTDHYIDFVLRGRWLVIVLASLVMLATAAGMPGPSGSPLLPDRDVMILNQAFTDAAQDDAEMIPIAFLVILAIAVLILRSV